MPDVVELQCLECRKKFLYAKKFNVIKKYCDGCARFRTAESKKKFREEPNKKKKEEIEEQERLDALQKVPIPLYPIRADYLFNKLIAAAL